MPKQQPQLDPDIADTAPSNPTLTGYDQDHVVTYLRLLDSDADGADWREVARIVLRIAPDREPDRARPAVVRPLASANRTRAPGFSPWLRAAAPDSHE